MKKKHAYISIIVLLLALNILQLSTRFFFQAPSSSSHEVKFKDIIPEILKLNEDQKNRFFVMADEHRGQMLSFRKQERILILQYIENPSESLLNDIAGINTQKIKLTENHFNDVFNMLNDQQKGHFPKFKQIAFQKLSQ